MAQINILETSLTNTVSTNNNLIIQDNTTLKRINVEDLKDYMLENVSIPEPTVNDNGKILKVINGKPTWVTLLVTDGVTLLNAEDGEF